MTLAGRTSWSPRVLFEAGLVLIGIILLIISATPYASQSLPQYVALLGVAGLGFIAVGILLWWSGRSTWHL
ncbi:MAG TPA: hypothetical protein VKF15_04625 [Nitrososphaerales archaeon]|nr:hypothetical protein [Nitrososphaerales archaeon]